MITPEIIKEKALRWWKPFLQSCILKQGFFPKCVDRIEKIKPAQVLHEFETIQLQVANLFSRSKNQLGYGYTIKTSLKNFRRTGAHEVPEEIEFETANDFIRYTGKSGEWKVFQKSYALINRTIPALEGWILANPLELTVTDRSWANILKVCTFFINTPRPNLYLRQLSIDIHTKFIENNETVLKSLLDHLIPDDVRDKSELSFAKRYYLKYDEAPNIRLRILDQKLAINNLTDLLIRLSDFILFNIDCLNILVTENKMNFLALPNLPRTLAIWSGGGFNISHLKGIPWMANRNVFYWGDLDIQGFHILHQMRSYYAQTKSIMMNKETFNYFKSDAGIGKPGTMIHLDLLTDDEKFLFQYLKENNLRLEQEKVNQRYADTKLIQELSN
jgi:hypothetical protein